MMTVETPEAPASLAAPKQSAGRTGRPKIWNGERSRKLTRLYVYTLLTIDDIMKLLQDSVFKPKKSATNKALNDMLGDDPRWIRPKSTADRDQRIQGLKESSRWQKKRGKNEKGKSESGKSSSSGEQAVKHESPHELVDFSTIGDSELFPKKRRSSESLTMEPNVPVLDRVSLSTTRSQMPYMVPPKPLGRTGTIRSDSTGITEEVKQRLPRASTFEAKQISFVMKRASLSSASESNSHLPLPASIFVLPDALSTPRAATFSDNSKPFVDPWNALPGDFFNLQLYKGQGTCMAGLPGHGATCWCAISEALSEKHRHWLAEGDDMVIPYAISPHERDHYGNTRLHLFASHDKFSDLLHQVIGMQSDDLYASDEELVARNTGGQTFLHVLCEYWYYAINEQSDLFKLLRSIHARRCGQDVIFARDVYGRTFFHVARAWLSPAAAAPLEELMCSFNRAGFVVRDAFGFKPLGGASGRMMDLSLGSVPGSAGCGPGPVLMIPPSRQPTGALGGGLSPVTEDPDRISFLDPDDEAAPEDRITQTHTNLVALCVRSYEQPRAEDAEGRNGLQCLALAVVDVDRLDALRNAKGVSRPKKRKHTNSSTGTGSSGASLGEMGSIDGNVLFDEATAAMADSYHNPNTDPAGIACPNSLDKLELLQGMLSSGVDPTHYDLTGNSVLHAFVEGFTPHPDSTTAADDSNGKEEAALLTRILGMLVGDGACGGGPSSMHLLESRNRQGETPLLLAARLGRQTALRALLRLGARPSARDVRGRGALEIIDAELEGCRPRRKSSGAAAVSNDAASSRTGAEPRAGTSAVAAAAAEKEKERADLKRYGRLEGCRALLTAEETGLLAAGGDVAVRQSSTTIAMRRPSLLKEWEWKGKAVTA